MQVTSHYPYRPINVCLCQEWSVLAPNEEISLQVKVFNQNGADLTDTEVVLTVYRPDFEVFAEYTDSYKESINFGKIKLTAVLQTLAF